MDLLLGPVERRRAALVVFGDPNRFALSPAPDEVFVRKLMFEGRGVADLEGVDVAGHFRIDGVGWLIVTDFDCPFEEGVRVHLLDDGFRRLDTVALRGPYVPGRIDHLRRTGPRGIVFSFPNPEPIHEVAVEPRETGWLRKRTKWLHLRSVEAAPAVGQAAE